MPLGKLLNDIMLKKDITAKELADKVKKSGTNIDKSYISKIVNNSANPSDEKIKAIANVLDYNPNALIIEKYFDSAPKEIKNAIDYICNHCLLEVSQNWDSLQGKTVSKKFPKLSKQEFLNQLNSMPRNELICLIASNLDNDNIKTVYDNIRINDKTLEINKPFSIGLPVQDNGLAPMGIKKNCTVAIQYNETYFHKDNTVLLIHHKIDNKNIARIVENINGRLYFIALQDEKNEYYDTKKHTILGIIRQVNTFLDIPSD